MSIILLAGCNLSSDESLSFKEVDKEDLSKDIQSFFDGVKDQNGVHLHSNRDDKNTMYFYFNERNVNQGEEAVYFTDFDLEADGDTLKILYESDQTLDYSDNSIKNEVYLKVNLDQNYETISVFNNGEETHFGTVTAWLSN